MEWINSNDEDVAYKTTINQTETWKFGNYIHTIPWVLTGNIWDVLFTGFCQSCESGVKEQSKKYNKKYFNNFINKYKDLEGSLVIKFDYPTNDIIKKIMDKNNT